MQPFLTDAIVFDLDGVLIDSERTNVASARDTLASQGCQLRDEEIPLVVGRHPVDYLPQLMQRHGLPPERLDALMARQYSRYETLSREEALSPGAAETLESLESAGYRVALATSSDRPRVEERLVEHGLLRRFEFLLTREDVARRKPAPDIYLLALQKLALNPERVVVIEDSPHGIASAKAAGLRCIALRTAWVSDEARVRADAVVGTLVEIPALVRRD